MDTVQAIVIAVIQGATELFPVSSLGHAVVLPAAARLVAGPASPAFLPFLVMLHVGTAVALLGFFWRDWLALGLGVLGLSGAHQNRESRRVFAAHRGGDHPRRDRGLPAGALRPQPVRLARCWPPASWW